MFCIIKRIKCEDEINHNLLSTQDKNSREIDNWMDAWQFLSLKNTWCNFSIIGVTVLSNQPIQPKKEEMWSIKYFNDPFFKSVK